MSIEFISHNNINKEKWDNTISESINGNYSLKSYFLDSLCPNWDAFIFDEYKAVFPIFISKKYGVKYFITPIFIPYVSLVVMKKEDLHLLDLFLLQLKKRVKYINLYLDRFSSELLESDNKQIRIAQEISLITDYETISDRYSTNLRRNLKKSKINNLQVVHSENVGDLIKMFKDSKGGDLKEIKDLNLTVLNAAMRCSLLNEDGLLLNCLFNKDVVASAFFSFCGNTITYVKGFSNDNGRKLGAMPLLIDTILRQFSQTDYTFDFGGSNDENVSNFNLKFGSQSYNYTHYIDNSLTFPLNLLKK